MEEEDELPMQMNRTLVLTIASVLIATIIAAFGAGIVVYAQQTPPTQLQPPAAPAPAKKPSYFAAKPQQKPRPPQGQPDNAVAQSQQSAAAQAQQPTLFDEHARQGNITICANVFGTLGRGIAANSTFTAQTQWDSKAGNAHSVQSLVAINATQNNSAQRAAGVVFAAPVGSSCEGNLVRVTPSPESCAAVAAELTKVNGQNGALGDLALIGLPNGAQVILVPFGNACVAVTTLRVAG